MKNRTPSTRHVSFFVSSTLQRDYLKSVVSWQLAEISNPGYSAIEDHFRSDQERIVFD